MVKTTGVVLYENVQPMDVIGPWEVYTLLTAVLQSLTPFVHAQASSGTLLIAWQG
jgi:hypothetical protein